MNRQTLTRIALFAVLVAAIGGAWLYRDQLNVAALEGWVKNAGALGPLLYIALYASATVLFLPGSLLTLAGGALFGPAWGTLYSLTGATLGATLAFLIARYLAREWVRQRTGGILKKLLDGVDAEGWKFVAFVRLVPLFPFNLLNYALGLTRIRLAEYVLATLLCMIPGAAGYAYLGHAGREALAGAQGWVRTGGIALGVLAALILLPWMLRHWRRHRAVSPATLAGWLGNGRAVQVLDVRSAGEYRGPDGRIEPSLLIPIDELDGRLAELEPQRDRPLVVV